MLFGGKKIKCNIKYKEKKFIYELDKQNTIKDIYNLFIKEESFPANISSLAIKLCSNKLPFNENEYDTPLISFDKDKYNELWFEITKPYNCPDCKKILSKYCLICGEYYCTKCKNNQHDKHDFVNIDPTNFKESVYLWNININATLSNDITQFNKLKDFIQENSLGTKIKLWKDNLIKKLNTFEKFINDIIDMCNKIGNNYIVKKSEELNKLMLDLSKTEQFINNELSIGKNIKNNVNRNNANYFSFDEAETLIKKLKLNYNDIKSKNIDIKDISKIENVNNLNDIMGNISSQIDELTKKGLNLFDSYKNFFVKYNITSKHKTNSILYPQKLELSSNTLANSSNNKNLYYIMKTNKNIKNKIYNLGTIKNNISIAIKDTTLTSKDSYSTCNKTGSRLNKSKKIFNSSRKDNYINTLNQGTNIYNELNLSKIKLKVDVEEKETFLYSDRYRKNPSIDKTEKIGFLPLITKI